MGFYDLSKEKRQELVIETEESIMQSILNFGIDGVNVKEMIIPESLLNYASDSDTYIRKNAYMAIGKIYRDNKPLREKIIILLNMMMEKPEEKIRQTAVYSLGEIGKKDADAVMKTFEIALNDKYHAVRNAVIGALKQMSQKNPDPTLKFAKKHIHSSDPKFEGK